MWTDRTRRERAELDAELAAYWERRAALDAEWTALRERDEKLTDRQVREMTDDELRADPDARKWLAEAGWSGQAAHRRMAALGPKSDVVTSQGGDGRDEFYRLPSVRVAMPANGDAKKAAADLAAWWELWGLGRPDVHVGVFENSLSEHGSYSIHYTPGATPEAVLTVTRWGHPTTLASGTAEEVLDYVAGHHWYGEPTGGGSDPWDDD